MSPRLLALLKWDRGAQSGMIGWRAFSDWHRADLRYHR